MGDWPRAPDQSGRMNCEPMLMALCSGRSGLLTEEMVELLRAALRRARERREPLPPARRWRCLRAGAETPLWNAVALAVVARLRRRGAKVRLARQLGISRQRLHLLLVARRAYPDAERALLLLYWLQASTPRGRTAPATLRRSRRSPAA